MDEIDEKVEWPRPLRQWGINGGRVAGNPLRLTIPAGGSGYANAQLDDYGGRRRDYPWRPGTRLTLEARFSRPLDQLRGTAGFGFWNAPFGDPQLKWPALPQAIWFFMGGPANDFPINPRGPGRGFYAATVDATRPRAWLMAPLAPLVVLLNRWPRFRQAIWPRVQQRLGMSYAPLDQLDLTVWHQFEIRWRPNQVDFGVDGVLVQQTSQSPRGPLGFVCWIDNQFLQVTPTGTIRAGTIPLALEQGVEVRELKVASV